MPKKRSATEAFPENLLYPVEVILAARRTGEKMLDQYLRPSSAEFGGGWSYLIKWEGYPDEDNTWEPRGNLNSTECIHDFWQEVGHDSLPTDVPGFQVYARPEWIAQQKLSAATLKPSQPTTGKSSRRKQQTTSRPRNRRASGVESSRPSPYKQPNSSRSSKTRSPVKPSPTESLPVFVEDPIPSSSRFPSFAAQPLSPVLRLLRIGQEEDTHPGSYLPYASDASTEQFIPSFVSNEVPAYGQSHNPHLNAWSSAHQGFDGNALFASELSPLGANPLTHYNALPEFAPVAPDHDLGIADYFLGLPSAAFFTQ